MCWTLRVNCSRQTGQNKDWKCFCLTAGWTFLLKKQKTKTKQNLSCSVCRADLESVQAAHGVSFGTMWNMPGCWLRGLKGVEKKNVPLTESSQAPQKKKNPAQSQTLLWHREEKYFYICELTTSSGCKTLQGTKNLKALNNWILN